MSTWFGGTDPTDVSDLPVFKPLPSSRSPFIRSHSVEEDRMCFLTRGLSFVCAAVLASGAARADLGHFEKEGIWYITITEEVEVADYEKLAAFSLQVDPDSDTIIAIMASPGGDAVAGMLIGKQLRDLKAYTLVPQDVSCASACALAYLGGVIRALSGRLGFHRPFHGTGEISAQDYREFLELLRVYFDEMSVSERLFEITRTTSPRNISWFDPKTHEELELRTLGLIGWDPIFEEDQDNRGAQRYGVNKYEYFRREDLAEACFDDEKANPSLQFECYDHTMRTGHLTSRRSAPPPLAPAPNPTVAQPEAPPPPAPEPVALPTPAPSPPVQVGTVPTPEPELPHATPPENIIFGPRTRGDPDGIGGIP
jgi:hypothetical protein